MLKVVYVVMESVRVQTEPNWNRQVLNRFGFADETEPKPGSLDIGTTCQTGLKPV
jgi:hypothetical protein